MRHLSDLVPFRRGLKGVGPVVTANRVELPVGDFDFLMRLSAAIEAAAASKRLAIWRLDGVVMERAEGGDYNYAGNLFRGVERIGFCAVSEGQAELMFYDGRTLRTFEKLGRQLFPGRSDSLALVVQALFTRDNLTALGPTRQQLAAGTEVANSLPQRDHAVKVVGPGTDKV